MTGAASSAAIFQDAKGAAHRTGGDGAKEAGANAIATVHAAIDVDGVWRANTRFSRVM